MSTSRGPGEPGPTIDFPPEVELLLKLENLKEVARQNPLGISPRRELVAEHSWHIALGVVLLAEYSPVPISIDRAVSLAMIHDIVEVYAGDTFAFGDRVAGQKDREASALERIRQTSSAGGVQLVADLWQEYEDQLTPEARFVKGVDALLPILLNYTNISHSSWKEHGVPAQKVRARLGRAAESLGVLAALGYQMIDSGVLQGVLQE